MKSRQGSALITVMVFAAVILLGAGAYLAVIVNEAHMTERQIWAKQALFLATTGIEKGMLDIKSDAFIPPTTQDFVINSSDPANVLENININVQITQGMASDLYNIISTSTVNGVTQRVTAVVQKNPSAKVFDYAYFVNNWGWFYGNGITANGDIRSNGRFDLRDNPEVNGEIYAGMEIDDGGDGIRGKAGTEEGGEYPYQHPNSERLPMPILEDISYYESLAQSTNGNIVINGATVIDGIFGDDPGESGNIVLEGTELAPIEINGTVVIQGDIIIKGVIKGQGTIYTNRNIYVADDITYQNGPDTSRPASDDPAVIDAWVTANQDKDLVGFAAKENIILGDYTSDPDNKQYESDIWYANYWLFNMGGEDVGEDSIPDTNDTGENNGEFVPVYEDLDGDGIMDDDYGWSDVQISDDITNFTNIPEGVTDFGDISTQYVDRIDGIFYTGHAFTGRVGYGVQVNGAIVSTDEAIIYRDTITMNYDERVHSRYKGTYSEPVKVKLPVAEKVKIIDWTEG